MHYHVSASKPLAWAACLAVLLLANPGRAEQTVASSTQVLDIRVGLTPGRTRLVFDLSGPVVHRLEEDGGQLRLELREAETASEPLREPELWGTPIDKFQIETPDDGLQRYVLELARPARSEIFALTPHEDRGHRLVLDIYELDTPEADDAEDIENPIAVLNEVQPQSERRNRKPISPARRIRTESPPVDTSSEWSGYLSLDTRLFFQSPAYPGQERQNISSAFEPGYYRDWNNGRQRLAFRPFFRYDANDSERTHADVRELYWRYEDGRLLFKAGLDVVFWGVTESRHLVDIINQTDLVENIDGEVKLGQPMLNLDYTADYGTFQLYLLPGFRERTFPGAKGRLRTEPVVDTDNPIYGSSKEQGHVDAAIRWSHYLGDWDVGLAHFSGTSRDPLLIPSATGEALTPLYLQIDQTSLDVQATKGAWLWKLESIYNQNKVDDYYAWTGGFEYTWFGVADSSVDMGFLLEYNYDERGDQSTTILQDDLYLGARFSGNDLAGTEILAALAMDTNNDSTFITIEAARRLGEYWTLGLESRIFTNVDRSDPMTFLSDDDYLEIQLSRYF